MANVGFALGSRVKVVSGALKSALGTVKFSDESYVGVCLDLAIGKHNGSINGQTYFQCKHKHGYISFAQKFELLLLDSKVTYMCDCA